MKVLIVGGGGREHALAWKCAQSVNVSEVFCAPGNIGSGEEDKVKNIPIESERIDSLVAFALEEQITLTIIGPEAPLAAGIVDEFKSVGLHCFGPTKDSAQLEASKAFTKDFLKRHDIPTGEYETFTQLDEAIKYINQGPVPIVVKADGLAAGKGVVVAHTRQEALEAARSMLIDNTFGEAGARIVVEEFLEGEEASFICMSDGEIAIPFASSQDHKARDNGDKGPNTGGMGAYSPAPIVDKRMRDKIMETIIYPTLEGMKNDGRPYQGFLYAGVMIGSDNVPKVLEFNCRFGDPETQPIMMRLKSDLAEACLSVLDGDAQNVTLEWDSRAALGVVLAAQGYPLSYETGDIITGLDSHVTDTKVFHAGTKEVDGECVTAGGRVLCVVGLAETVGQAQARAHARVATIEWQGKYSRTDIGYRAIIREK